MARPDYNVLVTKYGIEYYIDLMNKKEYFAQAGYSDAEWYCVLHHRLGSTTGLGQVIDGNHGSKLFNVLVKRKDCEQFKFTIPKCIFEYPIFHSNLRFQRFIKYHNLKSIVWYERDMITDDLARDAGLYPLIRQLQKMPVVVIGNKSLRGLEFLNYKHFVEISCPNLHLEPGGIEKAVAQALDYQEEGTIYLVSAGVSAALIIDQLFDKVQDSFLFDCGSIWDAFVGIGGQRQWRADLYSSPESLKQWKQKNLTGR